MKTMLFNPYSGKPRHSSDIASDPQGLLITDLDEPMLAYVPTKRQPLLPDDKAKFNSVINFAISQGSEANVFLSAWREGDTSEWPEFEAAIKGVR